MDDHSWVPALQLELGEEVGEGLSGIGSREKLIVDHASLLADGSYHGKRLASHRREAERHVSRDPALGRLLPQVEGGLVDVDDLFLIIDEDPGESFAEELLLVRDDSQVPVLLRI